MGFRGFLSLFLLIINFTALPVVSAFADDPDTNAPALSWITVIYKALPGRTISVLKVEDGTKQVTVQRGYVQARLPASLFPPRATPEQLKDIVSNLPPKVFTRIVNEEARKKSPCGDNAREDFVAAKNTVKEVDKALEKTESNSVVVKTENGERVKVTPEQMFMNSTIATIALEALNKPLPITPYADLIKGESHPKNCPPKDGSLARTLTHEASAPLSGTVADLPYHAYSSSKEVEDTIAKAQLLVWARVGKNYQMAYKSSACCAAYVSWSLFYGGMIKDLLWSRRAADMGTQLEAQGFENIFSRKSMYSTSESAPKGAVLVYDAGKDEYGHVEIKTAPSGKHGYISDYIGIAPPPPPKWKLIGIYVKPSLNQ